MRRTWPVCVLSRAACLGGGGAVGVVGAQVLHVEGELSKGQLVALAAQQAAAELQVSPCAGGEVPARPLSLVSPSSSRREITPPGCLAWCLA